MKECPTCHRTFDDTISFCPDCGTPLPVSNSGAQNAQNTRETQGPQGPQGPQNGQYGQYGQNGQYQAPYGQPAYNDSGDKADAKTVGIVAYLTVIGLIVAICIGDKKDPYVKFHLNQSIMICICSLFGFIPRIGILVHIACLAAAIYGLVGACQGRMSKIPVIGDVEIIK